MVTSSNATAKKQRMGDAQDPPTQKRLTGASKPTSGDPSPNIAAPAPHPVSRPTPHDTEGKGKKKTMQAAASATLKDA
ncbi:hypothetical protein BG006_003926, partial [Podila minutissima]